MSNRKGAASFVPFAAIAVPSIVGVAILMSEPIVLGGLLGVFFVLQFANNIDRRP